MKAILASLFSLLILSSGVYHYNTSSSTNDIIDTEYPYQIENLSQVDNHLIYEGGNESDKPKYCYATQQIGVYTCVSEEAQKDLPSVQTENFKSNKPKYCYAAQVKGVFTCVSEEVQQQLSPLN